MKKGFTLIELLAVIIILGIIALIAIPSVNQIIKESKLGSWEATADQMTRSATNYYQICQSKGKDSHGNDCEYDSNGFIDLMNLTNIAQTIEVKGEIPKKSEIDFFKLNNNGAVALKFSNSTVRCITGNVDITTDVTYSTAIPTYDGEIKCVAK